MDLIKADAKELVALHRHGNEWFARQARSQLLDRAAVGKDTNDTCDQLRAMFRDEKDVVVRLRALWTLFALGGTDATFQQALLDDSNEHVRTWGVRLLSDAWIIDGVMGPTTASAAPVDKKLIERLRRLAGEDSSGLVRLALASTLQRLPVSQRAALAAALVTRSEDGNDHNLPMMVWYGLIPVADSDPDALVNVANASTWPLVRRWIARRLGEDLAERPKPVDALLTAAAKEGPSPRLHDVLAGLSEGLAGKHKAKQPAAWAAVQSATTNATDPAMIALVRDLSVLFGDGRALGEVQAIALNDKADLNQRRIALETLIEIRSPDLQQTCEKLIGVRWLNSTAVKGLALFNDRKIGEKLSAKYKSFHHSERAAVIETLASRPTFAAAMLDEMAKGTIPKADLTAFQARQIRSFNDEKLTAKLGEVWGEIRDSAEDKQNAIAKLKQQLSSDVLASADPEKGRLTFNTACASCHRLYGHGGDIGPDLTGAGRQNLDYLLSNILDPSAVVAADFRMSIVQLADGRVLNGIVRAQTPQSVTLQGAKERVTVDRADIETMAVAPLSLMPDGLLQPMTPEQVRDLIAYLMTRSQVALAEQQPSK
jgi:putative heme-binding domain-containing protein